MREVQKDHAAGSQRAIDVFKPFFPRVNNLMADRAMAAIVMLEDIPSAMVPVIVLGGHDRPYASVGVLASGVTIVVTVLSGCGKSDRLTFLGLATIFSGYDYVCDGAHDCIVVHILVGNVRERDGDTVRVGHVNLASSGVGWTGADRMAIFGSNVETEARALRFWLGLIGVGESCGIGLSETDAGHQQGRE